MPVRLMREGDLDEARRIFQIAFGTFIGVPNPETFRSDVNYIHSRWNASPEQTLVAESDGSLQGSNFLARWGSFGFFGPLTVRPELWNQGVAKALLGPTVDLFDQWDIRDAGLYTFAQSPKHLALYQKFGFWPRFLTAIMSKIPGPQETSAIPFSSLKPEQQEEVLRACTVLTDSIYDGLDVTSEIQSVRDQNLGETVLLWNGDWLDAFAICHCGDGTEAGHGNCYVKFAAAGSAEGFDDLLTACESLAAARGLQKVQAGVSLARSQAYRQMLTRGFRTDMQGVAMHRPDSPAYNRPDVFVLDDWR